VVLLNGLVVVPDSSLSHVVGMVCVSKPIVVVIMARACYKQSHRVNVVKLRNLNQIANSKEHVQLLHYISAVKIVVVLDFLYVALLDLVQEMNHFGVVKHHFDRWLVWQRPY
jgi:hypothetical protein